MPSLLPLLFLFPLVELYLLIRIGGYIGPWPTLVLVLAAAMSGVLVLRRQGPAALNRVLARLQTGEHPATELAEAALLACAGLLLLLPGVLSDLAGLVLLVPGWRRRIAARLVRRVAADRETGSRDRTAIEGEFERRPEEPPPRLRDDP
jgi:UPF0716 protein FxsA